MFATHFKPGLVPAGGSMAHISEEVTRSTSAAGGTGVAGGSTGLPVRLTYRDMQKMIEGVLLEVEDYYD